MAIYPLKPLVKLICFFVTLIHFRRKIGRKPHSCIRLLLNKTQYFLVNNKCLHFTLASDVTKSFLQNHLLFGLTVSVLLGALIAYERMVLLYVSTTL